MTSAFNQDGSCAGGVVLLHGIARSARSRRRMQVALETAGFATLNLDYQSRAKSLQALVADISPAITGFASRIDGPMHFVAHSMSGLLARAYPNIRCCAPGASFCSARPTMAARSPTAFGACRHPRRRQGAAARIGQDRLRRGDRACEGAGCLNRAAAGGVVPGALAAQQALSPPRMRGSITPVLVACAVTSQRPIEHRPVVQVLLRSMGPRFRAAGTTAETKEGAHQAPSSHSTASRSAISRSCNASPCPA